MVASALWWICTGIPADWGTFSLNLKISNGGKKKSVWKFPALYYSTFHSSCGHLLLCMFRGEKGKEHFLCRTLQFTNGSDKPDLGTGKTMMCVAIMAFPPALFIFCSNADPSSYLVWGEISSASLLHLRISREIKTRLLQHRKYVSIFQICNKCSAAAQAQPSSSGSWTPNGLKPSLAQCFLLLRALAVHVKHVSSIESQAELAARNPAISFWDYQWPLCPVCWLFYLPSQSTTEAVLSNDWLSPACLCDKLPGPCSILTAYVTQHDFFPLCILKRKISVEENFKLAHAAV